VVSSSIRNLKFESDMKSTLLAWCVKRMHFVAMSVESEVVALGLEVCEMHVSKYDVKFQGLHVPDDEMNPLSK